MGPVDTPWIGPMDLPGYAVSAIANDDWSSFDDEIADQRRDIRNIREWLQDMERLCLRQFGEGKAIVYEFGGEGYFSSNPEFGLPATCVECNAYVI